MTVLAVIDGKPFHELPSDLFIPADALRVLLDSFNGPLDLLCYLIKRQNIDIMNIPVSLITKQYREYIQVMQANRFELAADYLVMAAFLTEIKSRLLLPSIPHDEANEEDPRMVLVRKIKAYESTREAVDGMQRLMWCERDTFPIQVFFERSNVTHDLPDVSLKCLHEKMRHCLASKSQKAHHRIDMDFLSVDDRISAIQELFKHQAHMNFDACWTMEEGRAGLVVSLLAVLECTRQGWLTVSQAMLYGPLLIKSMLITDMSHHRIVSKKDAGAECR